MGSCRAWNCSSLHTTGSLKVCFTREHEKTLSFETVLIPHNIQMDERLIVHVVHISGTRVADAVIDGISRGNNFGGIMRGINPLKFNSLQLGDL